MGGFKLQIDLTEMHRGIDDFERRLSAIGETLAVHGRGEVIAGRRPKLAFERRNVRLGREGTRTPNGAEIANFLRAKDMDPFKYDETVRSQVQRDLDSETADAIADAFRMGRPNTERVRRAIIGASMDLSEWVVRNIISGGLGWHVRDTRPTKSGKPRKNRLDTLLALGRATTKYGWLPPKGILTGRFVEAIRWRWRRGYRPGGATSRGDVQPSLISEAWSGRIT